ncbi:MAG: fimbrillin family protein [Prevotella sp.]
MKKTTRFIAMGAIVACMASCSENELYLYECGCDKDDSPCLLQVTDVTKDGYALTRAANEKAAFTEGDVIGLCLDDGSGTYDGASYNGVKLTKGESEWTLETKTLLSSTEGTLYAIYPYREDMSDKVISLSVDDAQDYLYDRVSKISKSNNAVSLNMGHMRAKLVVNIKKGNFLGDCNITQGRIYGSSLCVDGSFDLATDKMTASDSDQEIQFTGAVSAESPLVDEWFVFSKFGSSISKLSFVLTVNGVVFPTVTSTNSIRFERGKKYIFNITINNKQAEVTAVDIEPWVDTDSDDLSVIN